MIRETSGVLRRRRVATTDGEAARAVPGTTNTAAPSSTGDERCAARGTTPVRRHLAAGDLGCTATAAGEPALARCIDAITGVACSGSEHPSPPTSRPVGLTHRRFRGAARGAFSLAFPIPLRSDRGSLHRSRQVLVPVIASGRFGCSSHPAGSRRECQEGDSRQDVASGRCRPYPACRVGWVWAGGRCGPRACGWPCWP